MSDGTIGRNKGVKIDYYDCRMRETVATIIFWPALGEKVGSYIFKLKLESTNFNTRF